jgi:hypothetical protein
VEKVNVPRAGGACAGMGTVSTGGAGALGAGAEVFRWRRRVRSRVMKVIAMMSVARRRRHRVRSSRRRGWLGRRPFARRRTRRRASEDGDGVRAGGDELALCGVVGVVGIGVVAAGDGRVRGGVHVVG